MFVCMYTHISRNTARSALKQTPKILLGAIGASDNFSPEEGLIN